MKRLTISDLATMLNLSTSTVSRALADHPDISESTKNRVRLAAEEFNYTTNLHAKLFRKQNSGLIALILPEINMFFTPKLIEAINKIIALSNFSLITFLSNDSFEREKLIVKQCVSWAVEGVIISLSNETSNLDHLNVFVKTGITCVLLDKTLDTNLFPSVKIDDAEASYKATSYLIEKGHKHILGVFGNPNLAISQQRIYGFTQALKERKLPIVKECLISVNNSSDLDFILPPVLNHNKKISAIFTMSDELLAKAHFHLNALGLNVPQDMSMISISDGIYPYLIYPTVTHVKGSGGKMGRRASRYLIDCLKNEHLNNELEITIPTKLFELESVRVLE